ncbi:MAG: sulfite exporter TauE/SafE family protein [Proteobacteria bacterium]|nr:sulfite exporter TauE/SafE family protein [Pseudomonadota bacterium]
MIDSIAYWSAAYLAIGIFVGFFAGLLGIGGGTLLVPLLVFFFTAQDFATDRILHLAIGTSLASIVFTSFSSIRAHHAQRAILWPTVKQASTFLILGTFGGSFLAEFLDAKVLAGLFVLFAAYASAQLILDLKPKPTRSLPKSIGMGIGSGLIGILSSLVGIGGGVITIPLMVMHNVPMRNAVGTSAALGLPIALAGGFGYIWNGLGKADLPELSFGYVYFPALIGIVVGTFITVPFGAKLTHSMPVSRLKNIFAVILMILAIEMFVEIFMFNQSNLVSN